MELNLHRYTGSFILAILLLLSCVEKNLYALTSDKSNYLEAFSTFCPPKDTVFLKVSAQKGDNIARLLDRYALYEHGCNYPKFLELNKLPKNRFLKVGATYRIPVVLVGYNGKSIRSTLDITGIDQALRIQNYNDNARINKLRTDDFRKSKNLWVPYHEFACPPIGEEATTVESPGYQGQMISSSTSQASMGNRIFPIFGKKYERTPLIDRRLDGKLFYIVTGHGGPDVGATGKHQGHELCEDEYAYDVALRLTRVLVSHGATAYLIVRDSTDGIRDEKLLDCDYDEFVWGNKPIPRNQKARLQERCDVINELTDDNLTRGLKDQTVIEIHVDSRSVHTRADVYFYYRPGSSASKTSAENIHRNFLLQYKKVRANGRYDGTVSARDLHTLRETKTPKAVYIELANIRNPHDQLRIVLPRNRELLAKWIAEAFLSEK